MSQPAATLYATDPATRFAGRSDVHHAAKEGAGGENNRGGIETALRRFYADKGGPVDKVDPRR
jgi:hypothetical protein